MTDNFFNLFKRLILSLIIILFCSICLQILKPAFTVLIDRHTESILLLIRGTHSIRDTLTAATGAIVPFHHTLVHKGGVSDLVLGYAHCGMVAAARWIAKIAKPCLTKALHDFPDYQLKVIHIFHICYSAPVNYKLFTFLMTDIIK